MPWKSVKEKNPHDTNDCRRLRKFSWFRDLCFQAVAGQGGGGGGEIYALSFAQDKFNERTLATDQSDMLHCQPARSSDNDQSSSSTLAKTQTILSVGAGQVRALSLSFKFYLYVNMHCS
ncbi:hypothetical protein ACLKA7_008202 [Drosophila subpalustris]